MEDRDRNSREARDRAPQPISEILARLMARKGYARMQGSAELDRYWREVCGELANGCRCGQLRRGTLEVIVESSAVLQELALRKSEILAKLRECVPEQRIRELRLRIGAIR